MDDESYDEAMELFYRLHRASRDEIFKEILPYCDVSHGRYVGAFMLLAELAHQDDRLQDYLRPVIDKGARVSERGTAFPKEALDQELEDLLRLPRPTPQALFELLSKLTRDELGNVGI